MIEAQAISNQFFDELDQILEAGEPNKPISTSTHSILQNIIQVGVSYIAKKQLSKFEEIAKEFTNTLLQTKHIFFHPDFILQHFQDLKIMACKPNKLYQMGKAQAELKGYIISGKAVNVYKRKKKQEEEYEHRQQKQQLSNLIEQGLVRLVENGHFFLSKFEKHFDLADILLQHDIADGSIDQVYMGNQIVSQFVCVQKTIVLVVPSKNLKPDCLSFIKSSLLHVFYQEANLLNKVVIKETFYKNSILKGIFFIQEGQVEVKSGRVIARGWTTYGKCKTSGVAWKFKPVPFIRFLSKNSSIWKQFFNDITFNNEYPFNIVHILSLSEDQDFTSSAQWRSLGKKKMGRSPKLPKLNMGGKSMDEGKFEEIERMRHYDQRLNDVFSYKQDLLSRKLKGIIHGKFQPIFKDEKSEKKLEKKKKLMMLKLNSKASLIERRESSMQTQPAENILIMSVLKRLQSIADINETTRKRQFSLSHALKEKANPTAMLKYHRENGKILPMRIHEMTKQLNRNRRY